MGHIKIHHAVKRDILCHNKKYRITKYYNYEYENFISIKLVILSFYATAQNFDKMPVQQRDSMLITRAKAAAKKYAPGYYREYGTPKIERLVWNGEEDLEFGERQGRPYFRVTFPYDESKDYFGYGFSVMVDILGDDGTLNGVMGGHGFGRRISVYEANSKDKNIKIVPYVERKRPERH